MTQQQQNGRNSVTRKQGILVAVLGLVLVAVLLSRSINDGTAGDTPEPASSGETLAPRNKPLASKKRAIIAWPKIPTEQLLQQNPFAALVLPTAETQQARVPANTVQGTHNVQSIDVPDEPRRNSPETTAFLQSQKVTLILRSENKASAIIGEHLVHEGDVIDGVRILSILSNGILVEPVSNE